MADFQAITAALANRFAAASMTAPAGMRAMRSSLYKLPNQMPPLPCTLVFPEGGEFTTGNGTRTGTQNFTVRFYMDQLQDLPRQTDGLLAWLTVLADQLKGAVQLGGTANVARATIDSWSIGTMTYAGQDYAGIEFKVTVTTTESWTATA